MKQKKWVILLAKEEREEEENKKKDEEARKQREEQEKKEEEEALLDYPRLEQRPRNGKGIPPRILGSIRLSSTGDGTTQTYAGMVNSTLNHDNEFVFTDDTNY